jgi:tetratricopeptide (TPR) repeat protein
MNRNRVLRTADKYVRQGKIDAAIHELLKLVQLNPRDVTTINRVGDLYSKIGKKEEAIRHFSQIAQHYKDEGFLLKAIAIYKKITKLEPRSLDAFTALAELYSRQGLTMEARAQYQFVADQCLREDRDEEALEVLREMAGLYPQDLKVRLSTAELLGRMERKEEALDLYGTVGTELDRKGMHRESRKVYEAALGLAPGDNSLVRRLVSSLSRQGECPQAIDLLDELLEEAPEDPELLSLLGDAHLDHGASERAAEVYDKVRQLAPDRIENKMNDTRLCLEDGDLEGAFLHLDDAMREAEGPEISGRLIPYVQRLLDLEPHHLTGLAALARLEEAAGDEGGCRDALIRLAGASMDQGDLEAAAAALRHLIRLDPQNPRHSERLDDVLMKLSEQGDGEAVTLGDEQAPDVVETLPSGTEQAEVPADECAPGIDSFGDMEDLAPADEPLDQDFIAEHLTEAEVFVKYGLIDKAVDQLRTVVARYPHLLSARENLLDIFREEGDREAAVEQCRWIARIRREEGDAEGAAQALAEAEEILPGSMSLPVAEEAAGFTPADSPVDLPETEEIAAPGENGFQEADEEEEIEIEPAALDEAPSADRLEAVDGLLERGELVEARAVLLELRTAFPGHTEVEERLNRVSLLEEQARQEAVTAETQVQAEGGFDLAAEMDPELFQPQVAIEEPPGDLAEGHAMKDMLAAFRQGVEEQVGAERRVSVRFPIRRVLHALLLDARHLFPREGDERPGHQVVRPRAGEGGEGAPERDGLSGPAL